ERTGLLVSPVRRGVDVDVLILQLLGVLLAFLVAEAQGAADEDPLAVALRAEQRVLPLEPGRGPGLLCPEHRPAEGHGKHQARHRRKGKAQGKPPCMQVNSTWIVPFYGTCVAGEGSSGCSLSRLVPERPCRATPEARRPNGPAACSASSSPPAAVPIQVLIVF